MTLEKITKQEFDDIYNESVITLEKQLIAYTRVYTKYLKMHKDYRADNKTHRCIHYLNDKNILSYKVGTERKIGFKK